MEGRTIVRPDLGHLHLDRRRLVQPSMEGRTIVRPDNGGQMTAWHRAHPFNGGPDNCPARLRDADHSVVGVQAPSMEGRTIVRPDDAGRGVARAGQRPSMEGRTIVRPDPGPRRCAAKPATAFNGGPDNCPARQSWEARTYMRTSSFNGGPDNCPARRVMRRLVWVVS